MHTSYFFYFTSKQPKRPAIHLKTNKHKTQQQTKVKQSTKNNQPKIKQTNKHISKQTQTHHVSPSSLHPPRWQWPTASLKSRPMAPGGEAEAGSGHWFVCFVDSFSSLVLNEWSARVFFFGCLSGFLGSCFSIIYIDSCHFLCFSVNTASQKA